jgi:hypothetical protein
MDGVSNLDPAPNASSLRATVVRAVDVLEARKAAIGDGTEARRQPAQSEPRASRNYAQQYPGTTAFTDGALVTSISGSSPPPPFN